MVAWWVDELVDELVDGLLMVNLMMEYLKVLEWLGNLMEHLKDSWMVNRLDQV